MLPRGTGRLREGAKYYGKRIAAPYGRLKSDLASQTAVHSAAASVRRPQAGGISSPEGLLYPVCAESYVWFVNTENPLQVNAILRAVPDVETLTVVFRPLPQTTRAWAISGLEGGVRTVACLAVHLRCANREAGHRGARIIPVFGRKPVRSAGFQGEGAGEAVFT